MDVAGSAVLAASISVVVGWRLQWW
jgi:hypothetical protein